MPDELPDAVAEALDAADAFEPADGVGYRVDSTPFDALVTAVDDPGPTATYTVTVRLPSLDAATTDDVGDAVARGWFETLERRLPDAPSVTRTPVELAGFDLERDGDAVVVTYQFSQGSPATAARIAKSFVEYAEGTYVEGVIPGYDYEGVVADLLGQAGSGDAAGDVGGTPL